MQATNCLNIDIYFANKIKQD